MNIVLTCKEIVELITQYLEGSMGAEVRLRFERHVVTCPPCRGFLSQMRETIRLSGELTTNRYPPRNKRGYWLPFCARNREE